MKKILFAVLIGCLAMKCSASASNVNEPKRNEKIIGKIMPTDNGQYLPCYEDCPSKGWALSPPEIESAKPIVLSYIKANLPEIYKKLEHYLCQFYGIIVDGKKMIFFNFFAAEVADSIELDWQKALVSVEDGGDDFFWVLFSVESQECIDHGVHGYA